MPFCERCGSIQDLPDGWNHFDVLNVEVSLRLDENRLREHFYDLSRRTHPDRFSNAESPAPLYSLRWTTAINKAFQTLKDPVRRSYYVLDLHQGELPEATTSVPLDLAETYFELQDLISEPGGEDRLKGFRAELQRLQQSGGEVWNHLADEWGRAGAEPKVVLEKLRQHLSRQKYLQSMLADVDRKVGQ